MRHHIPILEKRCLIIFFARIEHSKCEKRYWTKASDAAVEDVEKELVREEASRHQVPWSIEES